MTTPKAMIQSEYRKVCDSIDHMATIVAGACRPLLSHCEKAAVRTADEEYKLVVQVEHGRAYIYAVRNGMPPTRWQEVPTAVKLILCPLLVHLYDKAQSMHHATDTSPPIGMSSMILQLKTARVILSDLSELLEKLTEESK